MWIPRAKMARLSLGSSPCACGGARYGKPALVKRLSTRRIDRATLVAKKLQVRLTGGRRDGVAPSTTRALSGMRTRWIAWGTAASLAVVLVTGGWYSSLDATCASCHGEQAARVADSAHTSTACYDCHLDSAWDFVDRKGSELFRMYPRAIGGVKLDGPGRRVSRAACTKCHANAPSGVLESKGLRIKHDRCAEEPSPCDTCHGAVAHGEAVRWRRAAIMDDCLACHERTGSPVECDTCHSGRLERDRVTTGPWQVTHGPRWQQTHGMGDLDSCAACHEPAKCVSCHKIEVPHRTDIYNSHGKLAAREDPGCPTCHTNASWCTSCHGMEMPHPAGFLKAHAKSSRSRQDSRCLACHAPEDCVNCHEAHVHPGMTQGRLGSGGP